MSAEPFWVNSAGPTSDEAFATAVRDAQYTFGCGGDTGTIAEKSAYVMLRPPAGVTPFTWVQEIVAGPDFAARVHPRMYQAAKARYENKEGPALCVQTEAGQWAFFGLAPA